MKSMINFWAETEKILLSVTLLAYTNEHVNLRQESFGVLLIF